jgi:hypothetical protein
MAGMEFDGAKKVRTMLIVRILITLLILATLLPGWGLLSADTVTEGQPAVTTDAIGTVSPSER